MTPRRWLPAVAIVTGMALAQASLAQPGFEFMPDGGMGLLRTLAGETPADVSAWASQAHDMAEWQKVLSGRSSMTETEIETLAGYLSVNFPLEGTGTEPIDLSTLPDDGKQLAIANCQTCHSIFTGYLMQRRDIQGWRSVFLSPFHREIAMSDKERETFALYSAINMPLDYDAVPPELRF